MKWRFVASLHPITPTIHLLTSQIGTTSIQVMATT